jgi:hypothetical protein
VADESTIRAVLTGYAGLTALVSSRIYDEIAPTNSGTVTRPFMTLTTISDVPENFVAGAPGVALMRIQFDIYADSKASAKAVLTQLRAALHAAGYVGSESLTQSLPADSPDLRRISSDWLFVLAR